MPAPRRAHLPIGSNVTSSYQTGQVGGHRPIIDILPTDVFVDAIANRGKHYTVIFRGDDAIAVSVNIRSYTGIGNYSHSRRLWKAGDARLSTTAHCAINAARRKIKENTNARSEVSR